MSNENCLNILNLRFRNNNFTPPRNRGGVIFSLQFVCVSVCVCVCPEFLWTKFQPNGCTDLNAVIAKWLLTTLARTLLKLVTLGQRLRSRWSKMYVKMMKKIRQKFKSRHFLNQISSFDWKFYRRHFDNKYCWFISSSSPVSAVV